MRTRCSAPVGLAARFYEPRDQNARGATVDIHLKFDATKDGLVYLLECGGEDLPYCGTRLGIPTAQDAQERIALRFCRALIDHDLRFAFSLVDGPRPCEDASCCQAVEAGVAMMAVNDLEGRQRLAFAVRRQRIELARTAVGAIAIDELARPDLPFDIRHV
jgi:hypothetical protein